MHQNGAGRKTRGGERNFLRPFLKRKEVRVGLSSPSSFVVPGTSCRARVRMVWPRPSAAKSIGKRPLSCIHLRFPAHMPFYSIQSLRLVVQHWQSTRLATFIKIWPSSWSRGYFMSLKCTKMHIIASDFSKISPGSMPPDPPAEARASPELLPSVRKLNGA